MSEFMVSWSRGKCLGKGSFGTVNLGIQKSDGTVFAVKSVRQSMSFSPQIQSFENEIRILRSLRSPYVVGYLGDDVTFESPTTSFRNLQMEYLPGGTVAESGLGAWFDEKLVQSRTWCVVSALSYLHSKGIVHCDVKGRNVLITSNPNFVKLADFGSAVEFSADDQDHGSGIPVGSPLWMAPEVIRGESQGPKSDIWSLGCTVIEMVTGKPAWVDFGGHTLSRIGYSDELPKFPSKLSEIGHDFLEKCLRRDPTQRWSSDQLLRHPFLASASFKMAVESSSPRCVLDWVNGDSDDDDGRSGGDFESGTPENEPSARDRLGKLSTSSSPNWESDGWLAVRSSATGAEATEASSCSRGDDDEGKGTSWEYLELRDGNLGRNSFKHSKPSGKGNEFLERCRNYMELELNGGDGDGDDDGGRSVRDEREEREIMIITLYYYNSCINFMKLILCCWKLLMKQLQLFTNYILYRKSPRNYLLSFCFK